MDPTKEAPNFSKLFEGLPPIVARSEVSRVSGGILTSKTMANHDSLGTGPAGRLKIGRKVAYEKNSLISWLESRATRLN
jgi:hypothetical protein